MDFCRSMRSRFRAAVALSPRDRRALAQAWFGLLSVDVALRVLPFRWVQELLAVRRKGSGDGWHGEAAVAVQRMVWLVGVAGRNHLYPMGCLRRSLVLQWLLGRRGIATDLRIGVQRDGDELRAHAWLEHAGQLVGDGEAGTLDYVPLSGTRVQQGGIASVT